MIIHAHTKKAMAVSVRKIREVPCLVEEMSQLIGGGIPITPQYVPAEQHSSWEQQQRKISGTEMELSFETMVRWQSVVTRRKRF